MRSFSVDVQDVRALVIGCVQRSHVSSLTFLFSVFPFAKSSKTGNRPTQSEHMLLCAIVSESDRGKGVWGSEKGH